MQNENIAKLIGLLTVEEKISLLAGADLWHTKPIPRLGIPALKVTDGPIGARGSQGSSSPRAACFPAPIAMGATWNPDLIKRVGSALADETRSKGAHILLGPTVNIMRSPLAGRHFEYFSEDPYHTAQLAVAYIKGVQDQGVGACIKHFVCNDSEYERMSISSEVDQRTLREIYLYPFEIAIREANPWSVMSAYNKLNGIYCSENKSLLLDILKGEWQYDGFVMSDWLGTYSPNVAQGGLDLEMPGPARWMGVDVHESLDGGTLSAEELDDKVSRILLAIQRVGAFTNPEIQPERAADNEATRQLARSVAEESIVLLKNQGILPVDLGEIRSIAVIGENAKWAQPMAGGSSAVNPHYVISPLDAIQQIAGDQVELNYSPGCIVHKSLPPLDMSLLSIPGDKPGGYTVELFSDPAEMIEPVRTFYFDRADITWSDEMLDGLDPQAFSVRLKATFTPNKSGTHQFSLKGNGLFRLRLNGRTIVDNWTGNDGQYGPPWDYPEQIGEINLEESQGCDFQLEYSWAGFSPWRVIRIGHWVPYEADLPAEAIEIASRSDIVFLFAGMTNEWESEGYDRPDMHLPGKQDELIERVCKVNPNTIVILNTGSPVTMPWLDKVPALLQTWYGGQELGNAVVGVLFGMVNPSGKLPCTMPAALQQNPAFINYPGEFGSVRYGEGIFVGYRYYEAKKLNPVFPFGHGLSYTEFGYHNLVIHSDSFDQSGGIQVSVDITNNGKIPGKEVVQLYVRDCESPVLRPPKELKAFQKLHLAPGETRTVVFKLDHRAFAYYNPQVHDWIVDPGGYELKVGASSQDIRLSGYFEMK